ncbi:helix-turn-helix domain-containing protein [Streptomyces sp. NPDC054838]
MRWARSAPPGSRLVDPEVRRLRADGMPIKQIARQKQLAPNTVRRLLRSERPPQYQRPPRPSVAAPFEPLILPLLRCEPALSAAEIARHIDWPASASLLRSHVARLRATLPRANSRLEPEPAFRPAAVLADPGWAECGLWWPKTEMKVGHGQVRRCPVLLMVAGASRHLTARLLPSARFRDV